MKSSTNQRTSLLRAESQERKKRERDKEIENKLGLSCAKLRSIYASKKMRSSSIYKKNMKPSFVFKKKLVVFHLQNKLRWSSSHKKGS